MTGMGTLGDALEHEHRAIDGGIEAYLEGDPGHPPVERLVEAMAGLRRHIYLEEEFLFPPMREAGMMMPIFVMLREHGALWNAMNGIDTALTDGADRDAVAALCKDLLSLLDAHNSKEEPVIYTQADAMLREEASAELEDFLKTGTMPEGWVCANA
ncbi:hemerythrin domain-containing protein [Humibacter albus]|jgi:hemerythrin-like domain-containing protein|uniref:hemerythrin domain-containing protein n=1 Tax=Humibacter albus TaxID=427754 RepID=UPI0003B73E9E|nr:hemerythrin domain-containing protein [Humibacter albus]